MVAKFLDDNKPKGPLKKSLKRHVKVNSHFLNFIDLNYSILFSSSNLAKFSGAESERTVSKLRKIKIKFMYFTHVLHN